MLTYTFILDYIINDIWLFKSEDMFDVLGKVLLTIGAFCCLIVIIPLDIIFSPIELIVFIVWKLQK